MPATPLPVVMPRRRAVSPCCKHPPWAGSSPGPWPSCGLFLLQAMYGWQCKAGSGGMGQAINQIQQPPPPVAWHGLPSRLTSARWQPRWSQDCRFCLSPPASLSLFGYFGLGCLRTKLMHPNLGAPEFQSALFQLAHNAQVDRLLYIHVAVVISAKHVIDHLVLEPAFAELQQMCAIKTRAFGAFNQRLH